MYYSTIDLFGFEHTNPRLNTPTPSEWWKGADGRDLFTTIRDRPPLPESREEHVNIHRASTIDPLSVVYYPAADVYDVVKLKGIRLTCGVSRVGAEEEEKDPILFDLKRSEIDQLAKENYRARVIRRVRAVSRAIVFSNNWDWFFTQTFSPEKVENRYSREECFKAWYTVLKAMNRGRDIKSQYVMFPEKHEDGAYHMHGFLRNVPKDCFRYNANGCLEIAPFADKIGYVNLKPIRKTKDCSWRLLSYALKYAEKSLSTLEEGEHAYFCSKGLSRGEKDIFREGRPAYEEWRAVIDNVEPDRVFDNEYCTKYTYTGDVLTSALARISAENTGNLS